MVSLTGRRIVDQTFLALLAFSQKLNKGIYMCSERETIPLRSETCNRARRLSQVRISCCGEGPERKHQRPKAKLVALLM